ncbi:MAG: hypothetical protein JJE03_00840 [Peptostreptococcaceae bacterium]|nr:hypothetical protein [Peptostreptococcaceae bacterium]
MFKSKKDYKTISKTDYLLTEITHYKFNEKIRGRRYKFYKSLRLPGYYKNFRLVIIYVNVECAFAKILAGLHILGDYVCIGLGIKIFGTIELSSNLLISVDSAVNQLNFGVNSTIVGDPTNKISDNASNRYIIAYENGVAK